MKRYPAKPIPLDKFKKEIIASVAMEKQDATREEFIALLRERSKVKLNQQVWQKIVSEGEAL